MADLNFVAQQLMGKPYDELTSLQQSAVQVIADKPDLNLGYLAQDDRTFWDRLADRVAKIGGSWAFIFGFILFLAVWAGANAFVLGRFAFDPYPFIFLNLLMSMIAALQAPLIMMSQNRQTQKDRQTAEHDLRSNLRVEIALAELHRRLDEKVTPSEQP
jgi:uncharacterized membrane protein